MSVEFQNGTSDFFGINPPDANEDTYNTTRKPPQVAWVAGGQLPTGGSAGPVSPPQDQFAQKPQPMVGTDPYAPSVQSNQPVLRSVARTELKMPSMADYIFSGLANALRGRASGAIFGALAAKGRRQQDINAMTEKQYEFDAQDQERRFRMQPKPHVQPTEHDTRLADFERVKNDPEVIASRQKSGIGELTYAEYLAGAEKAKVEASEGVRQPGRKSLLDERMSEAEKRLTQRLDETDRRQNKVDTTAEFEISNEKAWLKANPGKFPLDYVRAKAAAGAGGKVEGNPKPVLSDTQTMRKHVLAKGSPTALERFDKVVNDADVKKANTDLGVNKSMDSPGARVLFGDRGGAGAGAGKYPPNRRIQLPDGTIHITDANGNPTPE